MRINTVNAPAAWSVWFGDLRGGWIWHVAPQKGIQALLSGGALYLIGNGLMFYCNTVRFSSWKEFGYSLKINGLSPLCYAQRFNNPFRVETLTSAARELFGLLF